MMFTSAVFLFVAYVVGFDQWGSALGGLGQHLAFAAVISSWLMVIYLGLAFYRREDPARSRKFVGTVAGFVFVDFSLGSLVGVPIYLWWNALFLTMAMILVRRNWTRRTIVALGVGATLAGYAVAAAFFVPTYRERAQLREQYPIESLRDRLSYTHPASAATAVARPKVAASSAAAVTQVERIEDRLQRQKDDCYFESRRHSRPIVREVRQQHEVLSAAHASFVRDFVNANGFGPMRFSGIHIEDAFLVLPPAPPIPIPDVKSSPSSDSPGNRAPLRRERDDEIRAPLQDLHLTSLIDFANQGGFGFSVVQSKDAERQLDLWVGFQPHAFRKLPEAVKTPSQPGAVWRLKSLELVSLLTHETPRVYTSKNLPKMDELRQAPTRALNSFEATALQAIRKDEPVVFDRERDNLQMLGSLLAAEQCTNCHTAQRGDLLGAFSYRFARDPATPDPAKMTAVF
jgi:hypothetical protein